MQRARLDIRLACDAGDADGTYVELVFSSGQPFLPTSPKHLKQLSCMALHAKDLAPFGDSIRVCASGVSCDS